MKLTYQRVIFLLAATLHNVPCSASQSASITLSTSGTSTFIVVPTSLEGPIASDLKASQTQGLCKASSLARMTRRDSVADRFRRDGKVRRQSSQLDWLGAVDPANALWADVAAGRPLELIGTIFNLQFPAWQPAVRAAIQLVIQAGREAAEALGLNAQAIVTAAVLLFFIAFNDQNCLVVDGHTFLIPSEAISDTDTSRAEETVSPSRTVTSTSTSTKPCPPPIKAPNCDNCGGTLTSSICAGIKKQNNLYSSCRCFDPTIEPYTPFPNIIAFSSAYSAAQSFLAMTNKPKSNSKPTSASSPPSSPSSSARTSSAAVPKPTLTEPVCNEYIEEKYKKCFKPVNEQKVNTTIDLLRTNTVQAFIERNDGLTTSQIGNASQCYNAGSKVSYISNIGWIPGCTAFQQQNIKWPMQVVGMKALEKVDDRKKGLASDEVGYMSWRHCRNNKGLGGYIDVGCLRIGFYPTRVQGVFGGPPNYSKYFDDMKYC